MNYKLNRLGIALSCVLLVPGAAFAQAGSAEERNLTELRNTVVNLLQALVERGVLTREQAQAMVQDAQKKAEAEATAKSEENAIRVPYVPEIVKDEIRKEVVAEVGSSVTRQVVEDPKTKESLREA